MNALADRDFCAALILSLGHFLWQGTLVAGVAALVVRRLRTPRARYNVLVVAFGLMTISPFATWALRHLRFESATTPVIVAEALPKVASPVVEMPPLQVSSDIEAIPSAPIQMESQPSTAALPAPIVPLPDTDWQRFAPLMANVYLLGVAAMLARLVAGLWGGWQLRRRSTLVAETALLQALRSQAHSLGLKFVPILAYCERVAVPTVIGVLRPTILLPLSLTSGLAPEQVAAVLAHELAHVRRYDHLVNLLQRFVESLFFFHPAVWWLSNRIRIEREHCCDDLVVACGAAPLEYANSLLRVAELSRVSKLNRSVSAVSLLATGQPSKLRQRIARLLGDATDTHVRFQHRWPTVVLGAICLLVAWTTTRVGWSVAENSPQLANEGAERKVELPPKDVAVAPAKAVAQDVRQTPNVKSLDWPQWGGTIHRNNVAVGQTVPASWNLETSENVKWSVPLGSQTFGSPVIANGKIFIGTNNGHGYVKEHPASEDLGCLLAFDEQSGRFLWQASNLKLPAGRTQDWPLIGICSSVYCEGSKVWYVTNRAEVMCLDAEGFRDDGENDGPFLDERLKGENHADILWRFDMMKSLDMSAFHSAKCSITCLGDRLFVVVSNGVDESHRNLTNPKAPSFVCLDRRTGAVLWTDSSPSANILKGQWSSPCVFEVGGQAQVVMGGGDGWVYSFDPVGDGQGHSKLLWKYDTNAKAAQFGLGAGFQRNYCIATPVFSNGYVYIGNGQDPEVGEGPGRLHCIDPTKRGDVSPELAVDANGQPLPPRRLEAFDPNQGEKAVPNPNSAAVWIYAADLANPAKQKFESTFHRTIGSVAVSDNLLFVADMSGVLHCLDATKSIAGKPLVHWTHDLMAGCWGTPLIADGKVYIGNEDGNVSNFKLSAVKTQLAEHDCASKIFSTLAAANNTLFVATQNRLLALATPAAKVSSKAAPGNQKFDDPAEPAARPNVKP